MHRIRTLALAVSCVTLAACADDPVLVEQPAGPALAVAAATPSSQQIVDFNGKPNDFESRVAALGGKVVFVSEAAGFATVTGLTSDAAAQLGKAPGVGAVYDDPAIQLDMQPTVGAMEVADFSTVGATSVANPAGGIRFSYQWNMRSIHADQAWAAGSLGSSDVTVAILDTGIDYDGYDMNGKVDLSRSTSFIASDDAFIDAVFPGRNHIDDLNGHGSNVASQVSSNALIFAGVNSRATLIGVKVLSMGGSGSLGSVLGGVVWAADHGADVANMSLGVYGGVIKRHNGDYIGLVNKVFNYAHRKGMTIVVSAGNDAADMDNDGLNFRAYCEAPHVICVAAVGPTAPLNNSPFSGPFANVDDQAYYTNYGKTAVTVAGPGGNTRGYVASVCARHANFGTATAPNFACNAPPGFFSTIGYIGTSQASPHVAGLAAQVVAQVGHGNPSAVKNAIIRGADDLGAPGRDDVYGNGRINVAASLGL